MGLTDSPHCGGYVQLESPVLKRRIYMEPALWKGIGEDNEVVILDHGRWGRKSE